MKGRGKVDNNRYEGESRHKEKMDKSGNIRNGRIEDKVRM